MVKDAKVTITHGVLTDDAFESLSFAGMKAPGPRIPVEDDQVMFTVAQRSLATGDGDLVRKIRSTGMHDIKVMFTGDEAIPSWAAGEAMVAFTDAGERDDWLLPNGGSGDLASISRGGLNTQVNMAQSSYGDGATRYRSWVRITNNGISSGSVTLTVYDAETGEMVGQAWRSPSIPSMGAIQVEVKALEDHMGHTPYSGQQYNIDVSGGINGYVQHVMWNSIDGLFSDLSGFRAGGGLNTEP